MAAASRNQTFTEFLTQESTKVDLVTVGINLVIAAALAWVLGKLYVRYGRSPSDRRAFAAQFVIITLTTAVIIAAVKSSLALSLGLVGALSIVRFRSAVREHEELAFLFVAIALGLCFGADQRNLGLLGFFMVALFIVIRGLLQEKIRHENLYVKVSGAPTGTDPLRAITDILCASCSRVKLKRCDMNPEFIEASFMVEFPSLEALNKVQSQFRSQPNPMTVSVLDGEGIS